MALFDVLVLLSAVIGFAYFQINAILWTILFSIVLLFITLFGSLGFIALSICWLIFLSIIITIYCRTLRELYFISPIVKQLKKKMPPISETEREAIEAGHVWWEKDLFCGRPQWNKFLALPSPQLTAEEQLFLDNQVENLCGMLNDWDILNKNHDLPPAIWDYLKQERFFGMIIPKEFGGLGFSALAHSAVVIKIATRSISTAVNAMVPNSLGPAELLLHYGTSEQKNYYLPRLAAGQEVPCFALTGPEAGSDAGAMTDTGIVCKGQYEGQEILGIKLSWDKRYITLAPIATVLGLAFKLYDPDRLLGDKPEIGITLCLVPTSHPGVEIGSRHWPMKLAFMNGPTKGKDVFIPLDWIIGGASMAGQGWKMLMECLSVGRAISLPALSTACGKLAYRVTGAYSRLRRQFNTSISNFEGIEEALGALGGYLYTQEACRILTAGAVDLKVKPATASAIAKYHMTEMGRTVLSAAMDIHAGHAVQTGPRNFLANAYFALPISITVEGANILTRNLIIFGQGAIRCHPFILREIELFSAADTNLKQADALLMAHAGYFVGNFARNLVSGLTGGYLLSSPVQGKIARYYRQLTRMSSALALLADVCMLILGGGLKRKEQISARLGDILSQLYLASAVLKYFQDQGQPKTDLIYVKWSLENCLYQIQKTCDELFDNFPIRFVGKLLRFIIFPFGRAYQRPHDDLYHEIARSMIEPSALRDRLTMHCYLGKNKQDPIKRLDDTLAMFTKIEPQWKKFHAAVREGIVPQNSDSLEIAVKKAVLTAAEAELLHQFNEQYKEVIKVNEFSFDLQSIVS